MQINFGQKVKVIKRRSEIFLSVLPPRRHSTNFGQKVKVIKDKVKSESDKKTK